MDRRTTNDLSNSRRPGEPSVHDWVLTRGEEPPLAAHLVTPRGIYTHHGVYVGNGRVIHYAGFAGRLGRGPVEDVSLEQFAHGHVVRVRNAGHARFDRAEVVERARSRLGEASYRILTNNCEHFCEWCLRGEHRSGQVERWRNGPGRVASAAWTAVCSLIAGLVQNGSMETLRS
jgi:hypothetical protein